MKGNGCDQGETEAEQYLWRGWLIQHWRILFLCQLQHLYPALEYKIFWSLNTESKAFLCLKTCAVLTFKMTQWVRDDRKRASEHYWQWGEALSTSSFPAWKSTPFLSAAQIHWMNWFLERPLLPAPLMQRVLNDPVLSEVLKSQIPTETISLQYMGCHYDERREHCWYIQQVDTATWTPVNLMQFNTAAMQRIQH